ncbi:MAG: iron-sulfur cluster-binding protein [Chloroflexi bacterium]|nr:iron-sulfur cluster-binding protein [Chloroflexota bacterium]
MTNKANEFASASRSAIQTPEMVAAVAFATNSAAAKRNIAFEVNGTEHGEALRQQAAEARRRALRKLPELLEQAEARMQANGIEVLWAKDGEEASQHVLNIARQHNIKHIAKSKSMVSEEIGLNAVLETAGFDVLETDLGEYIIQLAGETPSHIVAPVIHKSKAEIRDLFMERLGMAYTDDAAEMTRFARRHLREGFLKADMGISGGNFIIAETGTLCLVTNEGNGRMVTSLPPVHVALVGIEKVIETLDDYATLIQLLARSATGQVMSVYANLINGPRRTAEDGGPERVVVILVDNGRSKIYNSTYAEALACIRCGSCLNACPVYEAIGGHAYGWVYSGPIGAVITPLLTGLENATPLPHASSLCGKCKVVCPVDIDLPRMLLDLRHDLVAAGHAPLLWRMGLRGWAMVSRSPLLFGLVGWAAKWGSKVLPKHRTIPVGPLGGWSKSRDLPEFAPETFHQLWAKREKGNDHEQP